MAKRRDVPCDSPFIGSRPSAGCSWRRVTDRAARGKRFVDVGIEVSELGGMLFSDDVGVSSDATLFIKWECSLSSIMDERKAARPSTLQSSPGVALGSV